MINKDKTLTVGMLISALKDGRLTADMPIAIFDCGTGTIRGINAFELHTHKDGSQALTFFDGAMIAEPETLVSTAEVFP
jgi:hypothetical protein